MNVLALLAGVLTIAAFGVHAGVGAREFRQFAPPVDDSSARTAWVQALSGWHWVSLDLLGTGIVFVVIGLADVIPDEPTVLLVLSGYFALTGLAWLGTVTVAGGDVPKRFVALGQWMFCFLVAALAFGAQ
ncbi:MAG: hypothetical protein Rubg2KO_29700 [Rubricoccaceae bacterium]